MATKKLNKYQARQLKQQQQQQQEIYIHLRDLQKTKRKKKKRKILNLPKRKGKLFTNE